MTEAYVFDAVRTPRGKGKKDGSLHEVKPVDLLAGTLDALRRLGELQVIGGRLGVRAPALGIDAGVDAGGGGGLRQRRAAARHQHARGRQPAQGARGRGKGTKRRQAVHVTQSTP